MTDDLAREKARQLLQALVGGKYGEMHSQFDEAAAKALPVGALKQTWELVISQAGPLEATEAIDLERKNGAVLALIRLKFAKAVLEMVVGWTPANRISGFAIRPAQPRLPPWQVPSYARQDAFTEEAVSVGAGDLALPGTLTLPKGSAKVAAVVLVHGSGPQDRDETIGPTKMFKDLAWALASRGVAVLRYEKGTRAHGKQLVAKLGGNFTLQNETVDDALLAVALARKHPRIDPRRVVYLGHSQGAQAGPRACAQDPKLAGVIMMAGPARPFEDVLLAQFEYVASLGGPNGEAAAKALPAIREAVQQVKAPTLSPTTPAEKLPLGMPASFWLDLRSRPADRDAVACTRPVLVLQGEADYQVTLADLALWRRVFSGQKTASFKQYPRLGHNFVDLAVDKARPEMYATVQGNVAEAVIRDIVAFVEGLR